MMNHYSTIIQFTAAIYLTLSFDNVLFRSLWSLDYARLINERISRLSLTTSSKIAEELKRNITANAGLIEKKSRLRGFFVLAFTIITMWIMGLEQEYGGSTQQLNELHLVYFVYLAFSVAGFIISCFFIERLLYQFFLCVSILIISYMVSFLNLYFLLECRLTHWMVINISVITSVFILIPLLIQLVTTWLYSENYYYMLSAKIKKEYDLYNQAIRAKKSEELPNEYREAISQCWYDKEQGEANDTKITNLSKTLKERLEAAIKTPSVFLIVKYAMANMFKIKKDELVLIDNSDIKGDVVIQSYDKNKSQHNKVNIGKPNNVVKKFGSQRQKRNR